MLFQAGPLMMCCIVTNIWQNCLTSIHQSIHHPLFPQSLPTYHLPQVQCDASDQPLLIILHKTVELWMTLELLDIDYKHLKWKAIMSISIWHKGFTADHRVIWINMLCHWQGMVQWWKGASFQIQFYKADNTKLLSLCLTGRVMRYKLNFSPGDETQWAGIWGKR